MNNKIPPVVFLSLLCSNLIETCFAESACVKSNPCQNGGWCSAAPWRENKYKCYCKENYFGENCTRGILVINKIDKHSYHKCMCSSYEGQTQMIHVNVLIL